MNRNRAPALLLLDVVAVLVFAAVGRATHDESHGLWKVLGTAAPFLLGCVVGWALSRAWRRPAALWPAGVAVWLCTVAVGMVVRAATGAGTAADFVVVATVVLGVFLLGWRVAVAAWLRWRMPERG
jgi:hypothetical protein